MKKPLYIVWTGKQAIDVPILDEQHHAIIATINTFYFFINQGWGVSALKPTLKMIKSAVSFHMKTEAGILEKLGADYKLLMKHEEISNRFSRLADDAANMAIVEQDPMILLEFLKKWWLDHHDHDHANYHHVLQAVMVSAED